MDAQQLIAQDARFSWMQGDAFETLHNCFEPEVETIPVGACRESAGRFGYLLQGNGKMTGEGETVEIAQGALVGIRAGGPRGHMRSEDCLTADTVCKVLWFPYDALEFACYRGCWFHARLIREVQTILGNEL